MAADAGTYVCLCRRSVGVRRYNKHLVFEAGDKRSTLGKSGDEQRGLADRDGFAVGFAVAGIVFDGGFDQGQRRTLVERMSGEEIRKANVEMEGAVRIGGPFAAPASTTVTSRAEALTTTSA